MNHKGKFVQRAAQIKNQVQCNLLQACSNYPIKFTTLSMWSAGVKRAGILDNSAIE